MNFKNFCVPIACLLYYSRVVLKIDYLILCRNISFLFCFYYMLFIFLFKKKSNNKGTFRKILNKVVNFFE